MATADRPHTSDTFVLGADAVVESLVRQESR
jgi:hypothetical protein